jgi:phosphoribosylanthranilate isomerase
MGRERNNVLKVKICEITNLEDALASIDAGCDALGFNFYKKSRRYISPAKAMRIIKELPRRIVKVGVFVNAKEKNIKRIARACRLNMLQFHGNESAEFCERFRKYKVIKAFAIKDRVREDELLRYRPFAYLFDNYSRSGFGGTGKNFDWKLIRNLDGIKKPVFLSGGLNADNVEKAIREVHPHWVDAASSLELSLGKKDHDKVIRFIRAVKGRRK